MATTVSRYAITEDECWRRLEGERIGRFATATGHGPAIVPVSFAVRNRTIFFRTGPGGKVHEVWAHPQAAFEVDGEDDQEFWSVVVEGQVHILSDDDPVAVDALANLVSVHPSPKTMAIELVPSRITGIRFAAPST